MRRRPSMELLEDRLAPAVLPGPVVNNPEIFRGANAQYSPQAVMDPTNPNNLVVVSLETGGGFLNPRQVMHVNYTRDGGHTWSNFNLFNGVVDPQSPVAAPFVYQEVTNPSVAADRAGNFYITATEHDPNQQSGAIVFYRFHFDSLVAPVGGVTPVVDVDELVLQQWYRGPAAGTSTVLDSAYHPTVAVDNNLPTYTDPVTGEVQTDSMATLVPDPLNPGRLIPKGIYVSWTSREVGSDNFLPDFSQNGEVGIIKAAVSGDGGVTFSTLENVSEFNTIRLHSVRPQMFFTQGSPTAPGATPTVQGGLLGFAWEDFGANGLGIEVDISQPDDGNALQPVAATEFVVAPRGQFVDSGGDNFVNVVGAILDGGCVPTQPNTPVQPHIAQTTIFELPVVIDDANFDSLVDMEVTVNIVHPNLSQLRVQLVGPTGITVDLLLNRIATDGTTIIGAGGLPQGVPAQANMGVVNGRSLGTVFNQKALRTMNPLTGTFTPVAPFVGGFQPEVDGFFGGLDQFNGFTPAQLTGTWRLRITDSRFDGADPSPVQYLQDFSLKFSARVVDMGFNGPDTFGTDTGIGATPLTSTFTTPLASPGGMFGAQGVGAGVVVAIDNTLGSFSPYQSRVYIAYTTAGADVQMRVSDDISLFGSFFTSAHFGAINDDTSLDNFSEGTRSQFMPSIAVDQVTGTLVTMWYDGRNDPSNTRAANYITSSTDGGETFSEQVFVNIPKTAQDALTGEVINIEPIPGNQNAAGIDMGFGYRQALLVYGGRAMPFFTSNLNAAGVQIFTAQVNIGAGPRILQGDQGPVVKDFTAGTGLFYNNNYASDGTRQLDGFIVTFDRPIDPASFGPNDVQVRYQDPYLTAGNTTDLSSQVLSVTPLDPSTAQGPNDPGTRPSVVLNDGLVQEGDSGQKFATLTISISQVLTTPTTISYVTASGSALANLDYLPTSGKVTIPAGQTSASFTVPILGDTIKEGNEFFWAGLSSVPTGIVVSKPLGRVTILDDDDSATLVVGDGMIKEGENGTTFLQFPVTLSAASSTPIRLSYATSNDTARAGLDYTATVGETTIPAGIVSTTILVPVLGDQLLEGNEKFFLNLAGRFSRSEQQTLILGNSGNLNATVTFGFLGNIATASFFTGSTDPSLAVNAALLQANLATIPSLAGNITVTSPVAGTYIVSFGNALAGLDVPLIQVVATATGGTGTITETQRGGSTDTITITRAQATGLIVDDDDLAISVGSTSVQETTDTQAVVTFHLNGPTSNTVTVNYIIPGGGTATNGADYTAIPTTGTVTFNPGELSKTITFPIISDITFERTEFFQVVAVSATNARVEGASSIGTVTIFDDDAPNATVWLADAALQEGDTGTTTDGVVRIRLSQAISTDVTGFLSTNFTANPSAGLDYNTQTNIAWTIVAGTNFVDVTLPALMIGDLTVENDEAISTFISNVAAAPGNVVTVGDATGLVTIVDDDVQIYLADAFGLERSGRVTFTAYLDSPKDHDIRFNYFTTAGGPVGGTDSTANNPANPGDVDFQPVINGTVTILAGTLQQTFDITVLDDNVQEYEANGQNGSFTVTIVNGSVMVGDLPNPLQPGTGMIRNGGIARGTIVDDDGGAFITLENPTIREGSNGLTTNMPLRIFLSQPQGQDIYLYYYTAVDPGVVNQAVGNEINQIGDDYDYTKGPTVPPGSTGTLAVIPAGATTFIVPGINVPINNDTTRENDESFRIIFCDPSSGTFTRNVTLNSLGFARATVIDDDRLHVFVANAQTQEGQAMSFPIVKSNSIGVGSRSINTTTVDGTASSTQDYTTGAAFVNIAGPTGTYNVATTADAANEGAENFTVTLSGRTIAVGNTGAAPPPVINPATGTIIDNDQIFFSIGDVSVQEVLGGPTTATFTVYISGNPNITNATVQYGFQDGTALLGRDYTGVGGTLTFTPGGPKKQTFTVTILNDDTLAGNKSFNVLLSNPVNAGVASRNEAQTITIDPTISGMTFNFNGVNSSLLTNPGILTAANILAALETIPALKGNISVTGIVNGPFIVSFIAGLSNLNVPFQIGVTSFTGIGVIDIKTTIEGGFIPGVGTIMDSGLKPALTVGPALAQETNTTTVSALFNVISSFPVLTPITVNVSTADGTATAASGDYVPLVNQAVTPIAPGTTNTLFTVDVVGDVRNEGEETFNVVLSGAVGATILGGTGTAIIADNDNAPNLSVGDVSIQEGDYGSVFVTLTVFLNKATDHPVSFDWSTADGTALANVDYVPNLAPRSIPTGQTSATFTIEILPDSLKEGEENFVVNLSNVNGASVYKGQATVTVQDGDGTFGATMFLVKMTPQSAVGTYSYTVGPNVRDRIRTALPAIDAGENGTYGVYVPPVGYQNLPIGGANPTLSQIVVSGIAGDQVTRDVTVTVNIKHPDPGDFVTVELISPSGQVVRLFSPAEFTTVFDVVGGNLTNTTFDDYSSKRIGDALPSFTGSFQSALKGYAPLNRPNLTTGSSVVTIPLQGLAGLTPNGTWTLRVTDSLGQPNAGTLLNWSLNLDTGSLLSTGQLGNYMDQNQNGNVHDKVRATDAFANPNPINGKAFELPYDDTTSPLIIPGPHSQDPTYHYVSQENVRVPSAGFGQQGTSEDFATSKIVVNNIPTGELLRDVNVTIALTHNRTRDLVVTLIAPDGTRVMLSNLTTFAANVTFDDQTGGFSPATYQLPAQNLSTLNGRLPNGDWVLEIVDQHFPEFGTLFQWTLDIVTERVALNTSISGLDVYFDRDINVATFVPGNILSAISPTGPLNASFKITAINPVATNVTTYFLDANQVLQSLTQPGQVARHFVIGFLVTGTQTPLPLTRSGTYSLVFGPDPTNNNTFTNYLADTKGNLVDNNLNAGLNVTRGADPTNADVDLLGFASGALAASNILGGGQTTDFAISITDAFLVQGATLNLDILHSNVPDLDAFLISPTGTRITLFSGIASFANPKANMRNLILDDEAATPIQNGNPPYNGAFKPEKPLADLVGEASKGTWRLSIVNRGPVGTLTGWSVNLKKSQPGTGLGEQGIDQFQQHFRVFVQDPTNDLTKKSWTTVGPAAENKSSSAGVAPVPAIAADSSDPSGNTVYVSTSNGGVWKTSNFLTEDPLGPTYVPLLDFSPHSAAGSLGLNVGALGVFGRNRDPNQSTVFVGTGGIGGTGVGVLRSEDGGATWKVLDSTVNVDAQGVVLPFSDPTRNHTFVDTRIESIAIDPYLSPTGKIILYIGVTGGTAPGLYRSIDSGDNWTLLATGAGVGNITDIVLAAGSKGLNGNLEKIYVGKGGVNGGVFFAETATSTLNLTRLDGGQGVNYRTHVDALTGILENVPVINPVDTPSTNPGDTIKLATPVLTGSNLLDTVYQGYIYAISSNSFTGRGTLFVSKDFGNNWTHVKIPALSLAVNDPLNRFLGTNDELYTPPGTGRNNPAGFGTLGDFVTMTNLAIDPNNPDVIYVGWASSGANRLIRLDLTTLSDPWAIVELDNSENDGGLTQTSTTGPASANPGGPPGPVLPGSGGNPYGIYDPADPANPKSPYYNALRDPDEPFLTPTGQFFINTDRFNNDGGDVRWTKFGIDVANPITGVYRILTQKDPLTGLTRVIVAGFDGLFTVIDDGNGQAFAGLGKSVAPLIGNRTGNLEAGVIYNGTAQPSILASDLAQALYYGMDIYGSYHSTSRVLTTGNLAWSQDNGNGRAGNTDPSGGGNLFQYIFTNNTAVQNPDLLPVDFFQLTTPGSTLPTSRTRGLPQGTDDVASGIGQWPLSFLPFPYASIYTPEVGNFAINPIDPTAMVISSQAGRIFRTSGPTTGMGVQWFEIGTPANLGNSYASAMAFGAPDPSDPTTLSNFIYAGTNAGQIYRTTTGGGPGAWVNITPVGTLDGSPVLAIVPNPKVGSKEVYAVTRMGVYWLANSLTSTAWVRLNDVAGQDAIFTKTRALFGTAEITLAATFLTDLAVDWRFSVPNDLTDPTKGTHPVLYLSTDGTVFRSIDQGVTWNIFPSIAEQGATSDGGELPNVVVTDLDLILGNTTSGSGFVDESSGFNMLYATTYGRSAYAIRLDNSDVEAFRTTPSFAPHVQSITQYSPNPQTTLQGIDVVFDTTVDPSTFSAADVVVTRGGLSVTVVEVQQLTTSSFRIILAPQSVGGNYTVTIGPRITDYAGNLMTAAFVGVLNFTPNTPPTISTLTDIGVPPNTANYALNFTISDTQTPFNQLVVAVTSSNAAFVPNSGLVVTGTGTDRTLTITPAAGVLGVTTITITVTDVPGLSTVKTFKFAVDTLPTLNVIANQFKVAGSASLIVPLTVIDPDPQSVTFLTPTTTAVTTSPYTLDQSIGLTPASANYLFNNRGLQEKWYRNPKGEWLLLLPNGNLHRAAGGANPVGPLVAAFDKDFYDNPERLLGLVQYNSNYQFNLHGRNEKWLINYGNLQYYALVPNVGNTLAELHVYNATAPNKIGALIATYPYAVYLDPVLLHEAPAPANPPAGTVTVAPTASVTSPFLTNLTINPPANFAGTFNVTVIVSDGLLDATRTFTVTIFNNRPVLSPISNIVINHSTTGSDITTVTLATSDPDGPTPTLVTSTAAIGSSAYNLDSTIGLKPASANFSFNARGLQEKWFIDNATGVWSAILPNGNLHRAQAGANPIGQFVGNFERDFYEHPERLVGLVQYSPTYAFNQHGGNEKWLINYGNMKYYALVPNSANTLAELHEYSATAVHKIGALVATFPLSHYTDPSLLHDPAPPANPPAGTITSVGNTLQIQPPANFIGNFQLSVTSTDGIASVTRTFQVAVVNHRPSFAAVPEQILSHNSAAVSIPLVPSDADLGDTVVFTAQTLAATSPAFDLDNRLGLYQFYPDYAFNSRSLQDKWLRSADNGKFYVMVPNALFTQVSVYEYDGFGINSTIARGPVSGGVLPIAYYSNPALLHEPFTPANPPAGTVIVVGNSLQITPPANYAGTFSILLNGSDGVHTYTRIVSATITNAAPTINSIPNVVMSRNATQQITLSGADGDGDATTFSVLSTAVAQQVFDLDSSLKLSQLNGSYRANRFGFNEKYLAGANGLSYVILPNGELHKFGSSTNPIGAFVATLPTSIYDNPAILHEAATPFVTNGPSVPPPPAGVGISLVGNSLTINPNGFFGSFELSILISDGITIGFRKFMVTTT